MGLSFRKVVGGVDSAAPSISLKIPAARRQKSAARHGLAAASAYG
jgi:hypothetical protein